MKANTPKMTLKVDGVMDGVNWANERKCFQGIFLSNHKLDGVMDGVNSTTLCDCT